MVTTVSKRLGGQVYPTLYKTAEYKETGEVFRVIAQDESSRDDVENLLVWKGNQLVWINISNLRPCF